MLYRKKQAKSARLVVRRYVMDIIFENPGKPVIVPSYNVLSKKLNVAKSTAQMELNALRDEGFLITKVGIGSFTNPASYGGSQKLFTIIRGDGKIVYANYHLLALYGELSTALAALSGAVQEFQLYSHFEEEIFEELRGIPTDAIIWIRPPKKFEELLKKVRQIHPVITISDFVEGLPGVSADIFDLGLQSGLAAFRRGLRRPLFISSQSFREVEFQGWKKAFADNGEKIDDSQFIDSFEVDQIFVKAMKLFKKKDKAPDCILYPLEREQELLAFLRRPEIDALHDCLLISNTYKPDMMEEPILMLDYRFDLLGKAAAQLVKEVLQNPEMPPEHRLVKVIRDDSDYKGELI